MKKFYKVSIVMFLSSIIVATMSDNVFAAEATDGPSEDFIQLWSEVFENSTGYTVFDMDGNDSTEAFLQSTSTFYSDADFEALYDYIAENNYTISWDKMTKVDETGDRTTRSAMLVTYEHEVGYSTVLNMPEFFEGKRAEVTYYIYCTYTVNDSTQQIVRCETPKLSVSFSPGDDFHYTQVSTSTPTPTISSDRSSATFKAKFSLKVQYQNSGVKYTYGPFYGKAVCYASGKYSQSEKW